MMHRTALGWIAHPRAAAGRYRCGGGPDIEAPDYAALAASNERIAAQMREVAEEDQRFRFRQYDELKPAMLRQLDLGFAQGELQIQAAREQADWAREQRDRYRTTGQPLEDQMFAEAATYGTEADQDRAAGVVAADAQAAATRTREAANRQLASMGVNPASGKFIATNRMSEVSQAAATAAQMSAKRQELRDKGIAVRAGASNFARGLGNGVVQGYAGSAASGGAAIGGFSPGIQSNLAGAGYVSGAVGGIQNALQTGMNGNMQVAGLQQQGYNQAVAASAQESAGIGSMVGSIVGAGATIL